MNLLFAGNLYGGFLSFFTILQKLKTVQFPMGAHPDWAMVAQAILDHDITTLIGMPSYLFPMLQDQQEKLRHHHHVEKIFYGGAPLNQYQREWLNDFGIKVIRSASYGSVDAGPLGYQCHECQGNVHHLHQGLHSLEILKLQEDRPVEGDEVGRLVFTTRFREAIKIVRYDIGDLGRWIPEECPCGRRSPRFELCGRQGDYFRAGGMFLNYQKFCQILQESFQYSGPLQIIISQEGPKDHLDLIVEETLKVKAEDLEKEILKKDPYLRETVFQDRALSLNIQFKKIEQWEHSKSSGKIIAIIDRRRP